MDHTACNPCNCEYTQVHRNFCDNCATDFQDIILPCEIWGEKVNVCSFFCMKQLERVWATKKTSLVRTNRKAYNTRPYTYTPGRTEKKDTTLVPCNCGVWHMQHSLAYYACALADFLPAYLLSLGVSLLTLFAYSAALAG